MIDQVFRVATEFRFDIGHAVLASDTLQQKVQGIADAADNALLNFQHLGAGIVASMGLGGGGLIGTLYKAIQVSDKFTSSQLAFSNIISSNMQNLQGDIGTFNDRLAVSGVILKDIAKVANEFSLDENALLGMTKMLAPVLIPHGAAGTNMRNAVDMGRNVLKSAPTLGVDPNEVQGQLTRAMMGGASMGDTLFRRLAAETSAFQGLGGKGGKGGGPSAAFNAMSFDKRFEMLHKGLNQFASDMDVVHANANTLNGNMQKMKNLFGGLNSILKPLGDAIMPPLLTVFREFNSMLDTKIRPIIETLSKMLKGMMSDPKALLATFLQMRDLGKDMKRGSALFGVITAISAVSHVAHFLGIQMGVLLHPFRYLAQGIFAIGRMVPWMAIFGTIARAAWFALSKLTVPLLAVTSLFQVLSRAKAIAKINDVQNLLQFGPRLTELFAKVGQAVSNLFLPFTMVFEALAEFIAPLFQVTTWLSFAMPMFEMFVDVLDALGKGVILAMASFQGLVFALMQFIDNIKGGKFMSAFDGVGQAMNAGIDDFLERNGQRLGVEGGAVVNQVTNIAKVEQRFEFKEQQEPDRIAFTVKEQLMKAARNPRQGRGTGLQNAFAR